MFRLLLIFVLWLLLSGCASGPRRMVDNSCAFAYFLPLPLALAAVGACTFGADAVLKDQGEEGEADKSKELNDV